MSLWLTVFILFVILWLIEGYLKTISDNLSYLIDLLEQNPDLVKKATDQEQSNQEQSRSRGDSMGSRRELYK